MAFRSFLEEDVDAGSYNLTQGTCMHRALRADIDRGSLKDYLTANYNGRLCTSGGRNSTVSSSQNYGITITPILHGIIHVTGYTRTNTVLAS